MSPAVLSREARKPSAATAPLRSTIRLIGTLRSAASTARCLRCRKRVQAIEMDDWLCTACVEALARAWDIAVRWDARP